MSGAHASRQHANKVTLEGTKAEIQDVNGQLLKAKQIELTKEVLELNQQSEDPKGDTLTGSMEVTNGNELGSPTDGGGFVTVVHRTKRRRNMGVIGSKKVESTDNGAFSGAERKVWLYVGKTSAHTTDRTVLDYLRQHAGEQEFTVDSLPFKGTYPLFRIGAPFNLKERLQDPEFWPSGVHVRRFNFMGRDFLSRDNALGSTVKK